MAVAVTEIEEIKPHNAISEVEELKARIKALEKHIQAEKPKPAPNPALLGLTGFGMSCFILQFANFGVTGQGPAIFVGFIFAGIGEWIAGIWCLSLGDNFGCVVYCTCGAFWTSLTATLFSNAMGWIKVEGIDLAVHILAFNIMVLILMGVAAKTCCAFFYVFISLFVGFLLLIISFGAGIPSCTTAAAYVLMTCWASTWYAMAHFIYKDAYDYDVFPVGPPPWDLFCKWTGRTRTDKVQSIKVEE